MSNEPKLNWGKTSGGVPADWPLTADGEPEAPAFVQHFYDNPAEVGMVVEMLRSYGIPSIRACGNYGTLGKIILGYSGEGVDLYVPAGKLEDAKNLLQPVDEAALTEEEEEHK